MIEYIPDFKSIIYDLSKIDESHIKGNMAYMVSIITMKHIFSDFKMHLFKILEYIDKNTQKDEFIDKFFKVFLYYIIEASGIDYDYIERSIETINNKKFEEDYMNAAQQLRKEGEEKGFKIGIEKGREEGIGKGIEKGLLLGKLDTAKNMYKLGIDLKKIQKATQLPLKEIRKIVDE